MCVYGVCACVSVKVTNQKKKISVHSKKRKEGEEKKEGKKESQCKVSFGEVIFKETEEQII